MISVWSYTFCKVGQILRILFVKGFVDTCEQVTVLMVENNSGTQILFRFISKNVLLIKKLILDKTEAFFVVIFVLFFLSLYSSVKTVFLNFGIDDIL